MNYLQKKEIVIGMTLLLGMIFGGLGVHLWDSNQSEGNRKALHAVIVDSQQLQDIDTKILNADAKSYETLATCVITPKQCNPIEAETSLKLSNDIYNGLIGPRKNTIQELNSFYKQFHEAN